MAAYELRKLASKDIFPLATILNKLGANELKRVLRAADVRDALTAGDGSGASASAVGYIVVTELVGVLLANLEAVQADLYKFLSGLSGLKVEELEEMPPADFMDMVVDVVQKEEFGDFFRAASRLFK